MQTEKASYPVQSAARGTEERRVKGGDASRSESKKRRREEEAVADHRSD